jgi:hypothetical protein
MVRNADNEKQIFVIDDNGMAVGARNSQRWYIYVDRGATMLVLKPRESMTERESMDTFMLIFTQKNGNASMWLHNKVIGTGQCGWQYADQFNG